MGLVLCRRFFLFLAVHVFFHITCLNGYRTTGALGRTAVRANAIAFTFIVLMLLFCGVLIPQSAAPAGAEPWTRR